MKCPECKEKMEQAFIFMWICWDCNLMLSENEIKNWEIFKKYFR